MRLVSRIVKYLRSLDAELKAEGLAVPFCWSNPTVAMSVDQLASKPVNLLLRASRCRRFQLIAVR